jgi:hypothetical protein
MVLFRVHQNQLDGERIENAGQKLHVNPEFRQVSGKLAGENSASFNGIRTGTRPDTRPDPLRVGYLGADGLLIQAQRITYS